MRKFIDIISEGLTEGVNDHYLYHGTDILSAIGILRTNSIDASSQYEHNPTGVSLSRDYKIAHEFGTMWDRQYPVVFVIDAQKLKQSRLKVIPRRDSPEPGEYRPNSEAEEMVLGDLTPLSQFVVSVNAKPADLAAALKDREWMDWMIDERGHHDFCKSRRTLMAAIRAFAKSPFINRVRPRIADFLDRDPPPAEELPAQFTTRDRSRPTTTKDDLIYFHGSNGVTAFVSFSKRRLSASPDVGGAEGVVALKEIKALLPSYRLCLPWGETSATRELWSDEDVAQMKAAGVIDDILPHGYFTT